MKDMTKEEKIKEAWGEYYEEVKNAIDKDGIMLTYPGNYPNLEFDSDSFGYIRPKSLQGIENNNNWVKIESESDLPENFTNVYCLNKNGNMFICESRSKHFFCHSNKWLYNYYDFTHYQPIEKPKPPLY